MMKRSAWSGGVISVAVKLGFLIVLCAALGACTEESASTGERDVEQVEEDVGGADVGTGDVEFGDRDVCDGNTACPDFLVKTLPVQDVSGNGATFFGDANVLPQDPVDDHGFCFASGEDEEVCRSNGGLSEAGSFSLVEDGLLPGRVYGVRAFATLGSDTVYGAQVEFTTLAVDVLGFEASQGESDAHVRLSWEGIEGVETYVLYRDGQEIARIDGEQIEYLDEDAAPGNAPSEVLDVVASQGDFTDYVRVSWEAGTFVDGDEHAYQLVAVYPDVESEKSAGVEGYRKAFELKNYEISINDGAFVDVGTGLEYDDTTTPGGEIKAADVTASQGTHLNHVVLSVVGQHSVETADVTYVVRAVSTEIDGVDGAAVTGPESARVSGFRGVGAVTLQWEHSTNDVNYASISGATTSVYNHSGADEDGTPRFYRARFSAPGTESAYSEVVEGARAFLSAHFVSIPAEADINQPFGTEIEVTNQFDVPFEGVSVSMMLNRDTVIFFFESFGTQVTDAQGRAVFTHATPVPWPGMDFLFAAKLPNNREFYSEQFRVDRAPVFVGSSTERNVAADAHSGAGQLSGDGRYLVFRTEATNLTTRATNGHGQVYRKDLMEGTVNPVSMSQTGDLANASALSPTVSADGRFVVFVSSATNLVAEVTSGTHPHIYVKDMNSGSLRLVSANAAGAASDWGGHAPAISADGRYVAFESSASNLVEQDAGGYVQVFRKDLQTDAIELVSHVSGEPIADEKSTSPAISADGRYVAFASVATNLESGVTGASESEIFLRDMNAGGAIKLVSTDASDVSAAGYSGVPKVSADGRYVTFLSRAKDFAGHANPDEGKHFYHKDTVSGAIVHVTTDMAGVPANDDAQRAVMSADGRFVAFESGATNYVTGVSGTHVYRKDISTGEVVLVSTNADGVVADNVSDFAAISGDGRYLAFWSMATNLVVGTTPAAQMYIRRVLVE